LQRACRILVLLVLGCVLVEPGTMSAQDRVTTFGVQVKPIFSSRFFSTNEEVVANDFLNLRVRPEGGYAFGMVIRRGISERVSFETGINYVRRVISLAFEDADSLINYSMRYRFITYEIPVQAMFYVQLGDKVWMNASGGISMDMYASDAFSSGFENRSGVIYDFEQRTYRSNWVQISLLANIGLEYRTKKSGYFYLGASFHRPFNDMAKVLATYRRDNIPVRATAGLSGTYLTLDLRYFFHEKPGK